MSGCSQWLGRWVGGTFSDSLPMSMMQPMWYFDGPLTLFTLLTLTYTVGIYSVCPLTDISAT